MYKQQQEPRDVQSDPAPPFKTWGGFRELLCLVLGSRIIGRLPNLVSEETWEEWL